ncbi:MAG: lipoyl synthase [Anaerolineae bacterium]|nr:lipoyl synthase [Anaerolineae bacterium]MCB0254855.1 lipoyl synthase [Anaerolineae bacterium]
MTDITIDNLIELKPFRPGRDPASNLTRGRRPDWLRVRMPDSPGYREIKGLMRGHSLHTVCEEAMCPNIGECWGRGTATFLLMGDTCTRSCGFCKIKTGRPPALDEDEPRRVAETVAMMGLKHAVLTSVNRDELPDGGAHIFAEVIRLIHEMVPGCSVEVLIPDFQGNWNALQSVMDARPEILNHNTETVPRLYKRVRPQAKYPRSLELLHQARQMVPNGVTKTGIMVGLGESTDEILQVMDDLRSVDVDILTIGQYLQPSRFHLPIERYYTPYEFDQLREAGMARGFRWVESGPLVRSSYHADGQADQLIFREMAVG